MSDVPWTTTSIGCPAVTNVSDTAASRSGGTERSPPVATSDGAYGLDAPTVMPSADATVACCTDDEEVEVLFDTRVRSCAQPSARPIVATSAIAVIELQAQTIARARRFSVSSAAS